MRGCGAAEDDVAADAADDDDAGDDDAADDDDAAAEDDDADTADVSDASVVDGMSLSFCASLICGEDMNVPSLFVRVDIYKKVAFV